MNRSTTTFTPINTSAATRAWRRWLYPALIAMVLALSQATAGSLAAHAQADAAAQATVNINSALRWEQCV